MRFQAAIFFLAAAIASPDARAEFGVVVSDEADHRLVLARAAPSVQAELTGLTDADVPMFGPADCRTLVARQLKTARSSEIDMRVIVARYNLVAAWTDNLCAGGGDVGVDSAEARAWADDLAGLRRAEDGAPFIHARRFLAEALVFGAPGFPPDYAAARRFATQEAATDPAMLLVVAYLDENGLGAPADAAKAEAHLRSAAARGERDAEALLAQASELGLSGAPKDEAGAFARYERLAEGVVDPPVWFRLGLMLRDGRGAPRDPCRAEDLLERARSHASSPVSAAGPALDELRRRGLCRR